MTTTHTAAHPAPAGIDLNLDKLEALARAATPGPWKAKNSDVMAGRYRLCPGVTAGGSSRGMIDEVQWKTANAAYIAAANPVTMLALIALARKAALDAPAADEQLPSLTSGKKNQADFRAACEKRGLEPSQATFELWQDARASIAHPIGQVSPAIDEHLDVIAKMAEVHTCGVTQNALRKVRDAISAHEAAHAQQAAAPAHSMHWPHGATEIACSSCGLTMGDSRLLHDLKRGEMVAISPSDATGKADDASAGALGRVLDKMEVIAQVVDSERLPNTANALRGLIEQVRRVDQSLTTSAADATDVEQLESRIVELRTALRRISETRFGYDGDCGVTSIADDALYADEAVAAMAASRTGGAK